jgi:hypothetical protein
MRFKRKLYTKRYTRSDGSVRSLEGMIGLFVGQNVIKSVIMQILLFFYLANLLAQINLEKRGDQNSWFGAVIERVANCNKLV